MLAKYEHRSFSGKENIWVGSYRHLNNLPHWHMEPELILCAAGSASITLDSLVYELCEGMCLLCPEGAVHSIRSNEQSLLWVCLCRQPLTKSLIAGARLVCPLFVDRYHVAESLLHIHEENRRKQSRYAEKATAIFSSMLVDIYRGEESLEENCEDDLPQPEYRALLSWIDREFNHLCFRDAAAYLNLSPPYFSRYFKKMAGLTFSAYLNAVKVERAVTLIHENKRVRAEELMEKCGFNTIRNMNRVFKNLTGYSPRKLPADFQLHLHALRTSAEQFDPTLESSVLL